jgi:hypothetical protein
MAQSKEDQNNSWGSASSRNSVLSTAARVEGTRRLDIIEPRRTFLMVDCLVPVEEGTVKARLFRDRVFMLLPIFGQVGSLDDVDEVTIKITFVRVWPTPGARM